MAIGSFTLVVEAEERHAETMAWVCGKTFGTRVLRQTARGTGGRSWSIAVPDLPDWPDGPNADDETGQSGGVGGVGHLIDLLSDAAGPIGPAGQFRNPEPPARKLLRHKLDLVLRCSRNLRAGHSGVRIAIQLPGSDPVSTDAVGTSDILDMLDA